MIIKFSAICVIVEILSSRSRCRRNAHSCAREGLMQNRVVSKRTIIYPRPLSCRAAGNILYARALPATIEIWFYSPGAFERNKIMTESHHECFSATTPARPIPATVIAANNLPVGKFRGIVLFLVPTLLTYVSLT